MPTPNEMVRQQAQANALRQQQDQVRQQQAQATANVKNPPDMRDEQKLSELNALRVLDSAIMSGASNEIIKSALDDVERITGTRPPYEKIRDAMVKQRAQAEALRYNKRREAAIREGEQRARQRGRERRQREGPSQYERYEQEQRNKRLDRHLDQADFDRIQRGY